MKIETLKSALKAALIAEYEGDRMMNPAIILEENGEFRYTSSLHGGTVALDLQEGCGAFSLSNIPAEGFDLDEEATFAASQWFEWCASDVADEFESNENE